MNVLDLFSGIGGFSIGLERAGMRTVAFCEIDPYCRAVLGKHWPGVPIFEDIRTLTGADISGVDVICGGFPCQDISVAGKGAGLASERSGLWREYARLIGEVRPRFVIVENVAALLGRGLSTVLGDLAEIGYDAEWHCIPASAVGAPHRRDRVWIVAYSNDFRAIRPNWRISRKSEENDEGCFIGGICCKENLAHPSRQRCGEARPDSERQPGRWEYGDAGYPAPIVKREAIDAFNGGIGNIWRVEPDVGRVANGVPARAHRLRSLGNAVVPAIPEIIGRAIMKL